LFLYVGVGVLALFGHDLLPSKGVSLRVCFMLK